MIFVTIVTGKEEKVDQIYTEQHNKFDVENSSSKNKKNYGRPLTNFTVVRLHNAMNLRDSTYLVRQHTKRYI
jgi:hypothetical protein